MEVVVYLVPLMGHFAGVGRPNVKTKVQTMRKAVGW